MFVDFMGVCFDQIFNQAAKLRYMFGGKAKVPLSIRTTFGAGIRAAAQHSRVPLPDLHAHPGAQGRHPVQPVRREGPSRARDSRRRPRHLLREQGPVRDGGRRARGALHDPLRRGERRPRGRRRHRRRDRPHGAAWPSRPPRSSPATASNASVIDPRTTSPLDEETIYESVEAHRAGSSSSTSRTRAAASRPTSVPSSLRTASPISRPHPAWSPPRTRPCRSARCSRTRMSRARSASPRRLARRSARQPRHDHHEARHAEVGPEHERRRARRLAGGRGHTARRRRRGRRGRDGEDQRHRREPRRPASCAAGWPRSAMSCPSAACSACSRTRR